MAQSRVEAILTDKSYSGKPLSRIEELLMNMGSIIDPDKPGGGGYVPSDEQDFDDTDVDDIMSVLSTEND